jgi:hypothetical protein
MVLELPKLPEGTYNISGLYLDGFLPLTITFPELTVRGYINEMQSCGCCTESVDYVYQFEDMSEEDQLEIIEEMHNRIQ